MKRWAEDEIVTACKQSNSMAEAATKINCCYNTFVRYAKKYGCYLPNQGRKGISRNTAPKISLTDILNGKHPEYQTFKLRNRLLTEKIKENKCECCGLTNWNKAQIQMELHHINGIRTDHRLDNLQMICPNCHSQTTTFRAKNIHK